MTNRGKRKLRPGPTEWGRLRAEADLSLRDLSARTGINTGLLSMLERGRWLPDPEQAEAITRAIRGAQSGETP